MPIEGKELALACAHAAEKNHAENIRIIDLRGHSSLTDFVVVCSTTSRPHTGAVTREVEKDLKAKYSITSTYREGQVDSRWVVIDYIEVMVHIMHQEIREHYEIEKLWKNGKELDIC